MAEPCWAGRADTDARGSKPFRLGADLLACIGMGFSRSGLASERGDVGASSRSAFRASPSASTKPHVCTYTPAVSDGADCSLLHTKGLHLSPHLSHCISYPQHANFRERNEPVISSAASLDFRDAQHTSSQKLISACAGTQTHTDEPTHPGHLRARAHMCGYGNRFTDEDIPRQAPIQA